VSKAVKQSGALWSERLSAPANARKQLPRMMKQYFAEVRCALAEKHSPAELHRVRLASKKIRYTLELFRPCYAAAGFDERMNALKDVQTLLGKVNDAVAASALLGKLMPHSPERKAVRQSLKERAAKKAEEFRGHWREFFDAPGQESWWTGFLGGHRATKNRAALRSGGAGGPS
jgi:CHAD domain-containing protein